MPLLLLSKSQPQGWVVILFNKGFFFGDSRSSFLFVTVDSNPHKNYNRGAFQLPRFERYRNRKNMRKAIDKHCEQDYYI